MKSTIIIKGTSSLAIFGAIICLLMLSACGNRAGDRVESKDAKARTAAPNEGGAIPVNNGSPTTSSAPIVDKPIPAMTQSRANDNSRVSRMPTPQVGTGGSDFFLFTQARAALRADDELTAANIVIDVKAGHLTLSGTVANGNQKSKAEELARAVDGVKEVKNQLRISIAKAEAGRRGE